MKNINWDYIHFVQLEPEFDPNKVILKIKENSGAQLIGELRDILTENEQNLFGLNILSWDEEINLKRLVLSNRLSSPSNISYENVVNAIEKISRFVENSKFIIEGRKLKQINIFEIKNYTFTLEKIEFKNNSNLKSQLKKKIKIDSQLEKYLESIKNLDSDYLI